MLGLGRGVLLRLRPAVVLAVVALAVLPVSAAALVAAVTDAHPVAVVLVTLAVALVGMVILAPVGVVVPVRPLRFRVLADRVRSRGDPASRPGALGEEPAAGRGGRRRSGRGRGARRRRRRAGGARGRGARARLRRCERRRDDRGDLAASGRRRGNGGLLGRLVEQARRGQNEANRHHNGEHAEGGCGYARKTTPHDCPIGARAPALNLSGGDRTSRPP